MLSFDRRRLYLLGDIPHPPIVGLLVDSAPVEITSSVACVESSLVDYPPLVENLVRLVGLVVDPTDTQTGEDVEEGQTCRRVLFQAREAVTLASDGPNPRRPSSAIPSPSR